MQSLYTIRRKKRIRVISVIIILLFIVFILPQILFACKPMIGEDAAIENATPEAMRRFRDSNIAYKLENITCRIREKNNSNIFSWIFGKSCYEVVFNYNSPENYLSIGVLVDCFTGEVLTE